MVLPVFFVPVITRFPVGLLMYWMTTNLWTVGQGSSLGGWCRSPNRRRRRSSRTPPKDGGAAAAGRQSRRQNACGRVRRSAGTAAAREAKEEADA